MREFCKVLCAFLAAVGFGASLVVWLTQWPNGAPLHLHLVAPLAFLIGALGFGWLHFQRDDVSDFLRQQFGKCYNRDGLYFVFVVKAENWIAYLDTCFQNQYDRPCVAEIELRPALGFWVSRAEMQTISLRIDCPAAGFGVARLLIAIPTSLRGKRQPFEVGTTVVYPNGQGRRLRFRVGIALLKNAGSFNKGVLNDILVGSKVDTVTLNLPIEVRDELPGSANTPQTTVLWQLGESIALAMNAQAGWPRSPNLWPEARNVPGSHPLTAKCHGMSSGLSRSMCRRGQYHHLGAAYSAKRQHPREASSKGIKP